jgi:hypothetical protein
MAALNFPNDPSNGEVYAGYVYDSAQGVWRVISAFAPTTIDSLTDVDVSEAVEGNALVFDGNLWVAGANNVNSGGSAHSWPYRVYIPGYTYETTGGASGSTSTRSVSLLVAVPFFIPTEIEAKSLSVRVSTATTEGLVRLGIYAADSFDRPGALVLDAGTVDGSTTGFKTITISQVLSPGLYYLSEVRQGGASTPINGTAFPIPFAPAPAPGFTPSTLQSSFWVRSGGVSAELPTVFATSFSLGNFGLAPRIWIGF